VPRSRTTPQTWRDLRAAACGRRERARPWRDLPPNQEEEKHAEHEIEAAESHERKEHGAGVNAGARPLRGPEETVDEPGLAASSAVIHPAVFAMYGAETEQQDPQHGPIALETSPPAEHDGDERDGDRGWCEPGHDVEGVVE